jgi:hypothetical protein
LVPGISPFTKWFSLERKAAGEVPRGYTYCFLVSPLCKVSSVQKVCRRKDGLFSFPPSSQLIDDFGYACGNGSPFFTNADFLP